MKNLIKKLSYIPYYFSQYIKLPRIVALRFVAYLMPKCDNESWLILERGHDAQDNAWHFLKYMVASHPEIKVRYAIKKNSPDYNANLAEYSDYVIEYNSVSYYIYMFRCSCIISTHLNTFTPSLFITTQLQKSIFKFQGKIVFLQHGIIHREMDGLKYPVQNPDLFISGAANEFELLKRTMNYPSDVIKYTGLARYDNLASFSTKKQVLIMPTWRSKYVHCTVKEFKKIPFFKAYKAVLQNNDLRRALEESGYNIVFYNHMEFQKFNCCFEEFESDNVHILKFGTKRVQELLKESAVLVTDYSSIYYDFLYMNKPMIFFQFDKQEFDSSHYGHNYDDPSEFGYVAINASEVVMNLISLINNGCNLEEIYRHKSDAVFKYRDNKNCERIFNAIISL